MTEKEIIINGVNVVDCPYNDGQIADLTDCYCRLLEIGSCSCGENCIFKQLTREKQKNKELEELNKNFEYELENMQGFNLLQELKEDLNDYKRWLENSRNENQRYIEQWKKYKQALEDIKSLIDVISSDCTKCIGTLYQRRIKEILSEVLDEE